MPKLPIVYISHFTQKGRKKFCVSSHFLSSIPPNKIQLLTFSWLLKILVWISLTCKKTSAAIYVENWELKSKVWDLFIKLSFLNCFWIASLFLRVIWWNPNSNNWLRKSHIIITFYNVIILSTKSWIVLIESHKFSPIFVIAF